MYHELYWAGSDENWDYALNQIGHCHIKTMKMARNRFQFFPYKPILGAHRNTS